MLLCRRHDLFQPCCCFFANVIALLELASKFESLFPEIVCDFAVGVVVCAAVDVCLVALSCVPQILSRLASLCIFHLPGAKLQCQICLSKVRSMNRFVSFAVFRFIRPCARHILTQRRNRAVGERRSLVAKKSRKFSEHKSARFFIYWVHCLSLCPSAVKSRILRKLTLPPDFAS